MLKKQEVKKIDAVFEGGGVKGSGLIGAVALTQSLGYVFENVAGTSAGAIVASLVAAGYTASEMKIILEQTDYATFKDVNAVGEIPVIGPGLNLIFGKGIYEGTCFENWIRKLLADKGVRTFGDLLIEEYKDDPLYRYKLQVIASDISRGKLLVLPGDSIDYGIEPDAMDVAYAIRMSMSIPYFYKPLKIMTKAKTRSYIVDGGILSNYPVWIFDDGTPNPPWPTIGYKLVDPKESRPHAIYWPITLFGALFSTMMEAHDARYIEDSNFVRTIPIQTLAVHTTDFDINLKTKEALYQSGFEGAKKFFENWDFEAYKKTYRKKESVHRTQRLWK